MNLSLKMTFFNRFCLKLHFRVNFSFVSSRIDVHIINFKLFCESVKNMTKKELKLLEKRQQIDKILLLEPHCRI